MASTFKAALDAVDARVAVVPPQVFQEALLKDIAEHGIVDPRGDGRYFVPDAPEAVLCFRPEYVPWMQAQGAYAIYWASHPRVEPSLWFCVRRLQQIKTTTTPNPRDEPTAHPG